MVGAEVISVLCLSIAIGFLVWAAAEIRCSPAERWKMLTLCYRFHCTDHYPFIWDHVYMNQREYAELVSYGIAEPLDKSWDELHRGWPTCHPVTKKTMTFYGADSMRRFYHDEWKKKSTKLQIEMKKSVRAYLKSRRKGIRRLGWVVGL